MATATAEKTAVPMDVFEKVMETFGQLSEGGKKPTAQAVSKASGVPVKTVNAVMKSSPKEGEGTPPTAESNGTEPEKRGKSRTLMISSLVLDDRLQMRERLNPEVVATYADVLRDGGELPPVEVWLIAGKNYLVEGYHRVEAHKNVGRAQIEAELHEGSMDDAVLHAARANAFHGLLRSPSDKKRAVAAAEDVLTRTHNAQPSAEMIARATGIPTRTVQKMMAENASAAASSGAPVPLKRIGADGRVRDVTNIGARPSSSAAQVTPSPVPAEPAHVTDAMSAASPMPEDPTPTPLVEEADYLRRQRIISALFGLRHRFFAEVAKFSPEEVARVADDELRTKFEATVDPIRAWFGKVEDAFGMSALETDGEDLADYAETADVPFDEDGPAEELTREPVEDATPED